MAYLAFLVSESWRSRLQWLVNASASDDEGVIGYQAQTLAPPYTAPSAAALLPSTKILLPTLFERSILIPSGQGRFCCAKSRPRRSAFTFDCSSASLPLYCS